MSLILKQEPANTISTPPAGKSTLFITDSSTMAVKNPDGTVTLFPTVSGSNTQVLFNDAGAINGNVNLVFNKTTGTMTVANLSVTGTLNAGDISVSSIANGTSNIDIVGVGGNVTTSVGGTANVLVVNSAGANITGNLSTSGNITALNITGNVTGNISGNAVTAGTVTTAAQPNITSTGTLVSLSVTGNIDAGNVAATTFTGALSGAATTAGTVTTAAQPNITSVGTLASLSVTATITGSVSGTAATITTAAQPNITSVGTLTSLSVSGNINAGNVTATTFTGALTGLASSATVAASANSVAGANVSGTVSSATTAGTVTTAAQPNITSTGTLTSISVSGNANVGNLGTAVLVATGTGSFGGNVNLNSFNIISLATPVNDTDAATKAYVDTVAQGLDTKASVVAATTVNITLSGTQTIDGIAVTAGQRVLVKNQTAPAENGLYLCAAGSWTRTTDMDNWTEVPGAYVFVETGTTQADTGWVCTSNAGGTIGVTAMTWAQFSGAGSYTAGTGLTLTGTSFSVNVAQSQITSVGTLTSLSVSGNINAGNVSATTFTGALTGLASSATVAASANAVAGANVSGTVSLATSATTAGTVTTAAQPNITSVGTLTSLAVTNTTSSGKMLVGKTANDVNNFGTQVYGTSTYTNGLQLTYGGVGSAAMWVPVASALAFGADGASGTTELMRISSTGLTLTNAAIISVGSNTNTGTLTGNFSLSAGSRLNATYADLAEKYVADATYESGTVLVFGGEHEVTLSTESDSFRVAGVVTTNPAYTMNSGCEGEHVVNIALQGRAPVKVQGPVFKGDLLVSSANGYATANNIARSGTIIGKSLENFNGESGIIEVAVGRF
jgi:hypothetical protein